MSPAAAIALNADGFGPAPPGVGSSVCFCARAARARREVEVTPVDADARDVRDTLDGDEEAYRRIVERHQPTVAKLMWRFSRDRIQHAELVQDTFVEAYRSLHTFGRRAPFSHWLYRVATRTGYRFWRRRDRERAHPTVPIEEWDAACEDRPRNRMTPAEAGALLHSLLGRLPPRDRLVLTLRFVEDRSVAETALATGWSRSMVKVQTLRARKKLRRLLEESGEEMP